MTYRVEHMDTNGVWHKSHRNAIKTYSAAIAKRDEVGPYGRVLPIAAAKGQA